MLFPRKETETPHHQTDKAFLRTNPKHWHSVLGLYFTSQNGS